MIIWITFKTNLKLSESQFIYPIKAGSKLN